MAAITQQGSAIRFNPSTGKFMILKGSHWVPFNEVEGLDAGYKVARGVHLQAAASDTIVTGLATVVAAVVSFQDAPTANIFAVAADVGDQAGAPAAGSVLIKAYKTPATPVAATVFSDNIHVAWVAWGT